MSDKQTVFSRFSFLLILLAIALLSACTNSVVVKGEIPDPLVERLPLNGTLRYTDEFKQYVYTEKEKKRALKSLDFNQAQIMMFDQIFDALITLVPPGSANTDLIIEPEVLETQYNAPSETGLKQFEVWIKYRIRLADANNEKIADWIIKGYGKKSTVFLSSASSGFNLATNIALRDVGAQLSTRFARQSKIKALLKKGANQSVQPEQATGETATDVQSNEEPKS